MAVRSQKLPGIDTDAVRQTILGLRNGRNVDFAHRKRESVFKS
jgi:hypothetical protein